jgi:hypothetical protein
MLTGAGLDQFWHHSRAHRLFALARWSSDTVGLALADLIVARLLPAGSPLTVAVDDTLFKRSGKKVFGVARHHDGAAKGLQNRSGSATGHVVGDAAYVGEHLRTLGDQLRLRGRLGLLRGPVQGMGGDLSWR